MEKTGCFIKIWNFGTRLESIYSSFFIPFMSSQVGTYELLCETYLQMDICCIQVVHAGWKLLNTFKEICNPCSCRQVLQFSMWTYSSCRCLCSVTSRVHQASALSHSSSTSLLVTNTDAFKETFTSLLSDEQLELLSEFLFVSQAKFYPSLTV